MHALLRLAATSYAISMAKQRAQHALRHGVLLLAVSIIAATGLGFLVAAFWSWVAMQSTPMIASLVVGGLFIVTAAIVYVTGEMSKRTDARPGTLADPLASITTQLRSVSDITPPSIGNLIVVVGAGYILGRIVKRR
jgi:hypothetical protein